MSHVARAAARPTFVRYRAERSALASYSLRVTASFDAVTKGESVRDLVERARRGDRDAFASLVHATSDRLYALASRILRDGDLAEDALQGALITAWRQLPTLRDPDRFEA